MHFGFEYRETVLGVQSQIDPGGRSQIRWQDDIVRKLNEEIVSSCARFYREEIPASKRAEKAARKPWMSKLPIFM